MVKQQFIKPPLRKFFIGGAIELFCHTYFWNPYQM